MSSIGEWLALTFGSAYIFLIIFLAISFVVGLVAAFSAAWWMGLICLIPPLATVNGIIYIGTFGGVNLAAKVVALIVGGSAASAALTAVG
jgi:hypothetical protein